MTRRGPSQKVIFIINCRISVKKERFEGKVSRIVILPKKRCWMYWREAGMCDSSELLLWSVDRTRWILRIYPVQIRLISELFKSQCSVIVTVEIDRREDPLFIGILTSFLR